MGSAIKAPLARNTPDFPFWLWSGAFATLVYAATIPINTLSQMTVASIFLLLLFGLCHSSWIRTIWQHHQFADSIRVLILIIGVYLTLRYLFWRTFYTLSYNDSFSFIAAMALYAAEVYAIVIYFLGMFVNVKPLWRDPAPAPDNPQQFPTVDVFVPTYDEDPGILETTLLAASQIRYPKEKLRIFLLDDGSTTRKCNDSDKNLAKTARARQHKLRSLCREIGVKYLTRDNNDHAKAGNINAAFQHTDGELLLILDADHAPTVDILEETIGWFLRDPKLFLVQSPHFFISPDPIERNLETYQHMPSENEMFYTVVQRGLDFWNSSFFCGSAAVLRRRALAEIGGISNTSITEDAATALALHSRGYRSAYLRRPLVSGLQPATFTAFIRQRVRWAQGMTQIFTLNNPLLQKGLRWEQRLSYLNSVLYWFFGYARIIFLLAPAAYLLLGLKIYNANLTEIIAYAVPHILAAIIISDFLYGKVRWAFISELYEYMQSIFTATGVTQALRNPRAPQFWVTPKNEQLEQTQISRLAGPFYLLLAITIASLLAGIYRYIYLPDERDVVLVTMAWEVFNLTILLGAMGALLERRQRREKPRIPVDLIGTLHCDGSMIPCCIHDLSVSGARISLNTAQCRPLADNTALEVFSDALERNIMIPVTMTTNSHDATTRQGLRFAPTMLQQRADIVALVHGSSERWRGYLTRRNRHIGIARGIWFLTKTGAVHTGRHFLLMLTNRGRSLAAPGVRAAGRIHTGLQRIISELQQSRFRTHMNSQTSIFSNKTAALVICLALLGLLLPYGAFAAKPEIHTLALADMMTTDEQITLRNASSYYTLFVPLSPRLQVHKARLHLQYTNSISLLRGRSQLRIVLNGRTIGQLPLKPKQPDAEADILLPVSLLKSGYNELRLEAAQHYTLECEDPTAPELWTQIDTLASTLTLEVEPRPVSARLSQLQDLIDRKLYGGYSLNIVTTGKSLDDAQLRWGSLISQGTAVRLDYLPLQVHHHTATARLRNTPNADDSGHHFPTLDQRGLSQRDSVLVGTRAQLAPLLGTSYSQSITGSHLGLFPLDEDPSHFLLIVSGTTEHEVSQAATAFAHLNFPLPDVATMQVTTLDLPLLPRYTTRSTVRENASYPFSEFDFNTRTVAGGGTSNTRLANLQMWFPADLHASEHAHAELSLHLAYGAALRKDSVLNISLNNRFEHAIPLSDEDGAVFRDYKVHIPLRSFKPGLNTLSFEPSMTPRVIDRCEQTPLQNLIITLFDDSMITIPDADHYVQLPDLGLFSRTGFPYSAMPDGSELAFQVGSRDPASIAAAWTLAGRLAQIKDTPLYNAEISFDPPSADRHLILIGAWDKLDPSLLQAAPLALDNLVNAPYPSLAAPVTESRSRGWWEGWWARLWNAKASPTSNRSVHPQPVRMTQQGGLGNYTVAMQFESPLRTGNTTTVFTATDSDSLAEGITALLRPEIWDSLGGDVAVWHAGAQSVQQQHAADTYYMGELAAKRWLGFHWSTHPFRGVLILLLLMVLIALMTRYLLARYKRRHHPDVHAD